MGRHKAVPDCGWRGSCGSKEMDRVRLGTERVHGAVGGHAVPRPLAPFADTPPSMSRLD